MGCCGPSEAERERKLALERRQESNDKLVEKATRALKMAAKYKKARMRAWTGTADAKQDVYKVGEKAYAHNPHYEDGTRLRAGPEREAEFIGDLAVLNDALVEVIEVSGDFAKVRILPTSTTTTSTIAEGEVVAGDAPPSQTPAEGWMRQRNLSREKKKLATDSERRRGLNRPPGLSRPPAPPKGTEVNV